MTVKCSKLPIDCYVIDHNVKYDIKVYQCNYCGQDTSNYQKDVVTGIMEDHCCDDCQAFEDGSKTFD